MNIAVLGPDGSYSTIAAKKYVEENNIDGTLLYQKTIYDLFELVKEEKAEMAIIPLENSLAGTIVETLDRINYSDLKIKDEIIIPINHCLITLNDTQSINKIISHPQAIAQCSDFLHKNYPDAELQNTLSTSEAISKLKENNMLNTAAIAREEFTEDNSLKIVDKNIEDNELNMTRFVVISKQGNSEIENPKTTVVIIPNKDMPGLLYSLLGNFSNRNINLTKIESRPSRFKMGEYIFFVDFIGSAGDDNVKECLESMKTKADVKILGTYENKIK
jgi:prephenate dehydratase|tara:strand:- start:5 stop:829 length:825 start_codon:yes stop_codon:yes gene_type:complete